MAVEGSSVHELKLPRHRLRMIAGRSLQLRRQRERIAGINANISESTTVRLVCISDTHNLQPVLPPGDVLIHAGDLTEWGTFDEIQTQLTWLSSQPHLHKILIAGNHDLLLDSDFCTAHPERQDPQRRTGSNLNFGNVTYLQDESVTISFTSKKRQLNVHGSPWTPRYGTSAFQYPREEDIWHGRVPISTDILITHGPPARFNDIRPSAGCAYLRHEVARVRPELMIFGHINVARGEQTTVFDAAQLLYDDIIDGTRGWEALPVLALAVLWSCVRQIVGCPVQSTRMINAEVVDGMKKDVALDAFVVDL